MIRFASSSLSRLVAFTAAIIAASCSQRLPLEDLPDAKLSYAEVNRIAKNAAQSSGVILSDFDEPVVRFEGKDAKHEWLIYFQMKSPPPPGGHFLVVVDDATSKAVLHPGE